jgi:hypothetical protein
MAISREEAFEQWAKENVAAEPEKPNPLSLEEEIEKAVIEQVAIAMAIGNNGGEWNINYTEDQRRVWRARAAKIVTYVREHS